jgi:uncharacterized membrane protein YkgB
MNEHTMTHVTFAEAGQIAIAGRHAADVSHVGRHATLYGLVLVFGWIGAMKFMAYAAGAIEGLVASSPLLSWLYAILDQRGVANLIGVIEITAAALLAVRPWSAATGAVGALLVAATTAITLTFLLTAPGWEPSLGGFPALSVVPGQFLVKDAVLLGAALWLLGDALRGLGVAR